MTEGRPLHSVFSELLRDDVARQAYAADPGGLLGQAGHGDLPDELLAEAIVSFADTAPPEIAEHLAPFVMAHSAVPVHDGEPPSPATGLELLADAPADSADTFGADDLDAVIDGDHGRGEPASVDSATPFDDLDFGVGARDAGQPADDLLDRPIETPDPMETPSADEFDEGPAAELPLRQIAPDPDGLDGEDDGLSE